MLAARRSRSTQAVVVTALLLGLLAVAPPRAEALIVATSGQITQIAPPPDARAQKVESSTTMFTWDEQQDVTLAAALPVDITAPGLYDDVIDLTPGSIPAGTVVSSHIVHADKVGTTAPNIILSGTVTFDEDIVGIAIEAAPLYGSDFLGAPGTLYPFSGRPERRLNLETQNDFVIWMVNNRTVEIQVETAAHFDQIRILTADPGTGINGCTPGFWKQPHHFDSWVGYAPTQLFNDVFGVTAFSASTTLLDAASAGGGGAKALGRHAVAALLSSAAGFYPLTTSQVIAAVQDAFADGGSAIEALKDQLEENNELGCPLS